MITYEYECWKCPNWHTGQAVNAKELSNLTTELGVSIRVIKHPQRLRVSNGGKLWLVPVGLGYGLLIGATPRRPRLYNWQTALWEYCDHAETESSDFVSAILLGPRS